MRLKKLIPVKEPVAEIEKIVNDDGETVYQVYYQQYDEFDNKLENEFDRRPQIVFTKELLRNHFESFDTLNEAKEMIEKYGYKVSRIL